MRQLTQAQLQALRHVRDQAKAAQSQALVKIERVLKSGHVSFTNLETLLASLCAHARVTLNFHPDRVLAAGYTVAEGLSRRGRYDSQFLTGVTNGSRTAFPGGDRDGWERKLFGGAYHTPGGKQEERPKYGALNVMNYGDGASPRYGSCYIVLAPEVLNRCTFTFRDSHTGPEPKGTIDVFEPVLAALLETVETTGNALGTSGTGVEAVVRRLLELGSPQGHAARGQVGRALDDYIEAQVHGDLDLHADVEALVADPAYRGTETAKALETLCDAYAIQLRWHPGFQLHADDVPEHFRGPAMPPLARRIAGRFPGRAPGLLDAEVLGRAAATLQHQPETWADWASPADTFQHIKQLWHVLVQYGEPIITD